MQLSQLAMTGRTSLQIFSLGKKRLFFLPGWSSVARSFQVIQLSFSLLTDLLQQTVCFSEPLAGNPRPRRRDMLWKAGPRWRCSLPFQSSGDHPTLSLNRIHTSEPTLGSFRLRMAEGWLEFLHLDSCFSRVKTTSGFIPTPLSCFVSVHLLNLTWAIIFFYLMIFTQQLFLLNNTLQIQ